MRIGELAERAGVTVKAVRYYEATGMIDAERLANGYRDYDESHVRLVREIHELGSLGIRVEETRPFLDCLLAGNRQADDCPDSVSTYRAALAETDARIDALTARRHALAALLASAQERAMPRCQFGPTDAPPPATTRGAS
jgi:Predicted transcriptional regulators